MRGVSVVQRVASARMRDTTHAVIGMGEVGHALAQLLPNPAGIDIDTRAIPSADVIHIAFPWTSTFEDDVERYAVATDAHLIVVHSTVPVGTCDRNGWTHSPVRGRHPDLVDGLKTFVKHVGGWRADDAARILQHDAGMTTRTHTHAATTEAGKLWELAQFGVQIAVEHAIEAWCSARGLSHHEVYAEFARTYNAGYQALGDGERFTRPILDHMPGPIGGHCVTDGADMLGHGLVEFALGYAQ